MGVNEITAIVNLVAEKLGVAAEQVYPMLLNQSKVFCTTWSIVFWLAVVSLVLCVLGMVLNINCYDDALEILGGAGAFVFGVIFIGATIYVLMDLNSYLTAIHNPDLWVIQYVMGFIK